MAALAYPFWFVVFPLVYVTPDKRKDEFLRFHAYQGLLLGLVGVVGLTLFRTVLSLLVRWVILLDVLLYPLLKVAEYGVLAAVVYGAVMAGLGRKAELPYLSGLVRSLFPDRAFPKAKASAESDGAGD